MKLSVIIPVFNTEHTLEACVESVLSQGVSDIEINLVDDGSEDQSPELCDALAEANDTIYAIHQSNRGLSAARNKGIEMSSGDYITFIDSDDSLAPYTLPVLLARLGAHPEYDILEYPVIWHYGSEDQLVLKFGRHEYTDMRDYWLDGSAYAHAYSCNKLFRRSLFDEVKYPVGRLFEDAYTLPRLLSHCRVVATTEEGAYQYTFSPEGIVATADGHALSQLLEVHVDMLEQYGLTEDPSEYYVHVLNLQLDVYARTKEPPILPELSALTRQSIKQLPVNRKGKIKLRLLKLLGINRLCKLYRLRHTLHRNH